MAVSSSFSIAAEWRKDWSNIHERGSTETEVEREIPSQRSYESDAECDSVVHVPFSRWYFNPFGLRYDLEQSGFGHLYAFSRARFFAWGERSDPPSVCAFALTRVCPVRCCGILSLLPPLLRAGACPVSLRGGALRGGARSTGVTGGFIESSEGGMQSGWMRSEWEAVRVSDATR